MEFNTEDWKTHQKGRNIRESILKILPATPESIGQAIQRSPSQVKRHLQVLRQEGKIEQQGSLITTAGSPYPY